MRLLLNISVIFKLHADAEISSPLPQYVITDDWEQNIGSAILGDIIKIGYYLGDQELRWKVPSWRIKILFLWNEEIKEDGAATQTP